MLFALLMAGCTPDRGAEYVRATALAEDAFRHGRYAEAAADYDEAARGAKIARDGDHARYLHARMLEEAGDAADARAAYDAIASATPPLEHSAESAFRAANLRIASGDAASGWRGLEAALARFPSSGLSRPGLRTLLRHIDDERGDEGALAYLRGVEATFAKTDCAEEVAYEIALRLARLGRALEARDAFVSVADRFPYPTGLLFDDSLYRASELDEQLSRYDLAIADLKRLLSVRESSFMVGSYERPRYDAAQLRIAELYRDRLHDHASARAALHELYTDFKTSLLREKALWKEAELWADDGDSARRCEVLATLASDFPDSRYVPCAIERCPAIALPRASRAPKACRPYVEREDRR
jgi:tetratricopeptide (TPR) repeat protein